MSMTATLAPLMLRRAFGTFPTGVTALAAVVDAKPVGLAVSSFTSVPLEPAMVLVCVAHASTTWPVLSNAPRLGISVLAADQQRVCWQLGAGVDDRFAGLDWHATDQGSVVLEGASAWFDCSIAQKCRAGDHDIVVLQVHDIDVDGSNARAPLVFHASRVRALRPER
ncbi:MAG: flavin reductase family protein [Acidimicrobiales bacterium]|jgi:flavin reductase (DIM6/NTAB) family NADH-FMN oxidoreductase RutF